MYNDIYYTRALYLWDSDSEAFNFDISIEDYANLILVKISQLGKREKEREQKNLFISKIQIKSFLF